MNLTGLGSDQFVEQIAPVRIHGFDQSELLLSRSALDLLSRVIASTMVECIWED